MNRAPACDTLKKGFDATRFMLPFNALGASVTVLVLGALKGPVFAT